MFLNFLSIFKFTIPVLLGYVSVGIAFGLLATELGIAWYFALFMSVIIYAGAAQFLALSLFTAKSGFFEIAISIFLLNIRHSFYGLSMIKPFKDLGFVRKYLIFSLTDETFALLQTMSNIQNEQERKKAYFVISLLNQVYWIAGTLLGSLIGNSIKIDYKGIEFALTALFVVLGIELYKKEPNKKIFFISVLVGLFGIAFLPSSQMLVISLFLCIGLLFLCKDWIKK